MTFVPNKSCLLAALVCLALQSAVGANSYPSKSRVDQSISIHRVPTKIVSAEFGTVEVRREVVRVQNGMVSEATALEYIQSRIADFGIENPPTELALKRSTTDQLGMSHYRFEQTYRGLRIWGCTKDVHFDSNGSFYLAAGQNIRSPNVTITPRIDSTQAVESARQVASAALDGRSTRPEIELLIYQRQPDARLAWLVTLFAAHGGGIRYRVFIDAETGETLHHFNDLHFDGPTLSVGVDLDGLSRPLHTYQVGTQFKLVDASRPMFRPPIGDLQGVIVTYWNKHHFGGIVVDSVGTDDFSDNSGYQAAVSAHFFAEQVYEYYANTFGYNSLSNTGVSILVNVHDSIFQNNAYWDGTSASFSDGDGVNWRPFCADLDIVGHELTHAVTEYTAGLIYEFESGALNESMSDFFGNMIERKNWALGDNARISPPGLLRNMANPHLGLDSNLFWFGYQPATMSEYLDTGFWFDNGGVHVNSGIPNHVGFLMSEAIGRDKAEQIWFRTLTTYLTPMSSFQYWSMMLMQSAVDLYGDSSPEVTATINALDSAGFGLLEVTPDSLPTLRRVLGEMRQSGITITNHRINDVVIDSVSIGTGLVVSGLLPMTLQRGDSLILTLQIDGTALGDCDLGVTYDTLRVYTSLAEIPTIEIPITLTTTVAGVGADTTSLQTACLMSSVRNDPGIVSFGVPGLNMLATGSLVIGRKTANDTIVYWHVGESSGFVPIDTISKTVDPAGDSALTFRFVTSDGLIHGKVRYRFMPNNPENCRYVVADYWLYNPCHPPVTIVSGSYCDWNVDEADKNVASDRLFCTIEDCSHPFELMYVQSKILQVVAAQKMVSSVSPNMRVIPMQLYRAAGFPPEYIYRDLFGEGLASRWGTSPADYAGLVTFGVDTLAPGDTARYSLALFFNIGSENGLPDVYNKIPQVCCTDRTGNVDCDSVGVVDISDLARLIDRLYIGFGALCCEGQANIDGQPGVDIGDLAALIDYLYVSFTPPTLCPR